MAVWDAAVRWILEQQRRLRRAEAAARAQALWFPISPDPRLVCREVAELALWQCLLPEEKRPDSAGPVAAQALAVATDRAADYPVKARVRPRLAPVMVPMWRRVAAFHLILALAARAAGPAGNQ